MLLRLGHNTLVCRNHQQHEIHPHHSGNHVVDKPLMPGNVNDADAVPTWKVKISKSKVNGNSPSLLLLPAVRIPSRQSLDQRGLPMVNMTGRTNDYIFHILTLLLSQTLSDLSVKLFRLLHHRPAIRLISSNTSSSLN